ncbi:hypothetical protein [Pseudomonas nitroreducens]|uniref:Phage coat protein n=1 Tax=Pseudomonas nitroreducens TaxID=46680 RepID=A0A6G6IZX4_PSENT|nr:hypothetical protein [Pseudomonas nitroreducens]QIE87781.1 hypothetical protein G5B91_16490 [Pseudomonas nitroreducens]QIE87792.1 hypothetical protein G5B91_16545 [Pseudomonas nitroreducens]QIE87803.1 hypothetical protein G5B91_16600 [Pseudomonas nitroreducens]
MEKLNKLLSRAGVVVGAGFVLAATSGPAAAAGAALDFSAITGAIDASTIVAAIAAIAAIKVLPGVAKWGYNKVIGWFR